MSKLDLVKQSLELSENQNYPMKKNEVDIISKWQKNIRPFLSGQNI